MAHDEQRKFVSLVKEHFLGKHNSHLKILEIGSYIVTLSIKDYFKGCEYLGVDLIAGPGVDLICSGHEVNLPDASFDVAISCEVFEHNPYWAETFQNMYRMTKPGGMVVLTCASRGRPEHGTARSGTGASPGTEHVGIDYYRNLNASDFKKEFRLNEMFTKHFFFYLSTQKDLYFCGWKNGNSQFSGNIRAFIHDVKKIRMLSHYKSLPLLQTLLGVFNRLIITVTSYLLSDRSFQIFLFKYEALLKPFKEKVKKVISFR